MNIMWNYDFDVNSDEKILYTSAMRIQVKGRYTVNQKSSEKALQDFDIKGKLLS